MDWKPILKHAGYEDNVACIEKTFEQLNISTLLHLQNSPARLGSNKICGHDIFQLIVAVSNVFSEGIPTEEETSEDEPIAEGESEEETISNEEELWQ